MERGTGRALRPPFGPTSRAAVGAPRHRQTRRRWEREELPPLPDPPPTSPPWTRRPRSCRRRRRPAASSRWMPEKTEEGRARADPGRCCRAWPSRRARSWARAAGHGCGRGSRGAGHPSIPRRQELFRAQIHRPPPPPEDEAARRGSSRGPCACSAMIRGPKESSPVDHRAPEVGAGTAQPRRHGRAPLGKEGALRDVIWQGRGREEERWWRLPLGEGSRARRLGEVDRAPPEEEARRRGRGTRMGREGRLAKRARRRGETEVEREEEAGG
jgi:hypothetical protein